MFVDSHCHINFPEFAGKVTEVLAKMRENEVSHALCVGVNFPEFPQVRALAEQHSNIYASVGVHPDYEEEGEVAVEELLTRAKHDKVIAIGETGLDYYRLKGDLAWQKRRFRNHIQAARKCGKPLIIHMREAAADTLKILAEEGASETGGVMHCFTGNWETAHAAMALGFYISFSGIVTFKNATSLREIAVKVPLERMLIETDSPYLAPVPHRGKTNQPAFVRHVAEEIARLRNIPLEEVGQTTTQNFFKLFKLRTQII
ncbi:MAG TPA: TatD family hydrolase [Burkholderiales bacterium]|nr:TatD family hydrolase [Burkholderiales bacterium]